MRKIISESIESVLENVQYRRNSFEILGYDFMVDEELKMWLIEVNSSPTMEYSTKVTTRLVKRGMGDLAKVI
jgi:tubulin monoglycylase TTLL3/8